MKGFDSISDAWQLEFPKEAASLLELAPGAVVVAQGKTVRVPGPPLTEAEIRAAANVAEDWGIPRGFVPVAGNFHDLVCLDLRSPGATAVVIIDDLRSELAHFASIQEFVAAVQYVEEAPINNGGIVGAHLDF